MTEEHGYTLVELLVGMTVTLVLLGAVMTIVQAATRHQDRVAEQVAANQRARPTMTRIVDRLHSACVSPGLAPVRAGSDGDTLLVLSKAGDDVSPTPDMYALSLEGGALSETAYPALPGGEAPDWDFSETPTYTRELLDGVSQAELGEPAEIVPVFRYYAYDDGQVENQPLTTPLDAEEAALTVQVDVAFTVAPHASSTDPSREIAVSDSATLRIEPASEDSAEVNLPCV